MSLKACVTVYLDDDVLKWVKEVADINCVSVSSVINYVSRRFGMTRQEVNNEYDLLKGNINRMFVTNNCEEFQKMYEFALKRLDRIYDYNYHRLVDDDLPFK